MESRGGSDPLRRAAEDEQLEGLFAIARGLDMAALLLLAGAGPPPPALLKARRQAAELIRRRGLTERIERAESKLLALAKTTTASARWLPRDAQLRADLRRQAAPALRDVAVACVLGPALDGATRELLLAGWREATSPQVAPHTRASPG